MTDIIRRRDFLIGSGAGALAGLLITPANAVVRGGRALTANTIYRNARMWTGARSQPWTDAIALHGNRIVALGERAAHSLATRSTQVIDLGGAMVVPGMMDNHTHFVSGSKMLTQVDLLSVKTRQQLVDTLARGAAALPYSGTEPRASGLRAVAPRPHPVGLGSEPALRPAARCRLDADAV